jgi:two-component system chemotaxis response regulator CheY
MAAKPAARVLIIDDNDLTRTLLRGILRGDDCEVIGEASNGKLGLEMALRLRPNVVCLDVVMPETGGLEVLEQLRGELPGTAVLMVTGTADRETVQAAVKGGAAGYIVKPFNAARVLDAIRLALENIRTAAK